MWSCRCPDFISHTHLCKSVVDSLSTYTYYEGSRWRNTAAHRGTISTRGSGQCHSAGPDTKVTLVWMLPCWPSCEVPVYAIWIYNIWKCFASLLTECTLQYVLRGKWGKKNKRESKESTFQVLPNPRASEETLLHILVVLSLPMDVTTQILKKNIKEVWILVQRPPLPTYRKKNPRKQCVRKIPLESKIEFRLRPTFHKAVQSVWRSTINIPSKVGRYHC